jgi:hypothetical protein
MRKNCKHVPPALKHGIYSGIGLLPTEDPVKFQKFKKERFAELALVGPLEEDIGEEIVCFEWRRKNLATYALADRARVRHSSIYFKLQPLLLQLPPLEGPETRSPEELDALRKAADEQARAELGAAVELVKIGDVATFEFLQRELALRERLDVMIARAYKKLLYVRGIKSMTSSAAAAPSQPLLDKPA